MSERTDSELHELADDLFEAGRAEAVPPAARARAFEAAGLAQPPVAPAVSGTNGAALKWGATAVGVAGVGALFFLSRPAEPPVRPPPAAVEIASAAAPAAEPPPAPVIATASVAAPVEAPPSAPSASQSAAAASAADKKAAPVRSGGEADPLAAELAALDRARSTLRGGNPNDALRVLAEYDKSFPRGALRSEALMLRVEALTRAGRKDEAVRLAEPIIRANPEGLAAKRLKGLLE